MKATLTAILALLIFGAGAISSDAAQRVYYGYPAQKAAQDGEVWILSQEGLETARLGSLNGNKKVIECLQEASGLDKLIRFSGNWQNKEYGEELDPASARCFQIEKKADCPKKILRTVTVDAINMGVVCGDFCHLGLLPEYGGDEFSIFADEEEIEKLFGSKPGKKVRVTYVVEMDWMPDNFENPDSGDGICGISAYFKSGKVLGK